MITDIKNVKLVVEVEMVGFTLDDSSICETTKRTGVHINHQMNNNTILVESSYAGNARTATRNATNTLAPSIMSNAVGHQYMYAEKF